MNAAAKDAFNASEKMRKEYNKAMEAPNISEFCANFIAERAKYHTYMAYKEIIKHAPEV